MPAHLCPCCWALSEGGRPCSDDCAAMLERRKARALRRVLYVAGPMTDVPDLNRPAFRDATKRLRGLGFKVVNPHEHEPGLAADELKAMEPDQLWRWYMHLCLQAIGTHKAEALVYLPASRGSRGATSERLTFATLELPAAAYDADWDVATYDTAFQHAATPGRLANELKHCTEARVRQLRDRMVPATSNPSA